MIPISRLSIGSAEANAASEVIQSGWVAQGKRTEKFEQLVADYVGSRHAIAVSSATTGIHLALVAAGVKAGDEVICPSYSFIATANAIVYANATPVFVDIDPRTYNINPSLIEAAITPRTTAILPVSQVGLAADLDEIKRIARKHKLVVVEDAAPSLGAKVGDRFVGSISDFTVFSFDARKILTTGEGGIITTNDDDAAMRLRVMRAHSASASMLSRHTSSNVVLENYPELGYNYKMTDIAAAIGVVQMDRVEEFVAERRRLASRYAELLAKEDKIELPYEPAGYRHVFQSFTVRLRSNHSQLFVMSEMAKDLVATRRVIACHLEGVYRRKQPNLFLPESETACNRTLLLPMFVGLTEAEQDIVVQSLRSALKFSEMDKGKKSASHMKIWPTVPFTPAR
jgi:dTDP-4-amino-4,6-dideoxygalactose transaminase